MAEITVTTLEPAAATTAVLVVPLLRGESEDSAPIAPGLPALDSAIAAVDPSASKGSTQRIPAPADFTAESVLLVGLGASQLEDATAADVRFAFGAAARSLTGTADAAITVPGGSAEQLAAAIEGFELGAYTFDQYKKESSRKTAPAQVQVLAESDGDLTAVIDRAQILAQSVGIARDLVNTPPNVLFPQEFARRAEELSADLPIEITVLDEKDLVDGGYGGISGVGQGSTRPPRLVRLDYRPEGATSHVALVGKGITFDSGGISIKPAAGMDEMTMDMAGAASVLAATIGAARLELPVQVTTFLALAENLPGGAAQRPGDVVTMRNGTTVEVLNTDAEGRMVLADALVDAAALEPDLLVDVATLTGAMMVALGTRTAGVMGTEDAREDVVAAAKDAGEEFWPLPFPEEMRETLNGRVADLANIGERFGGGLSAGVFLSEFVSETSWAHLDIAGTAYTTKPYGYNGKGGTGMSVRTLISLIAARAN